MKRLALLTTVLAMVVVTAACGDDDSGDGGDGTALAATATNFAFSPDLWTVGAGDAVTLTLTNSADQTHEWVIMSAPITAESEFTEEAVIWEMESEAGQVATDTFTAPAAGTYQIICALEGHFDAGMEGELVVTG